MTIQCPLCGKNNPKEFKDKEFGKHVASIHKEDLRRNSSLFKSLVDITHNPKEFADGVKTVLNPNIDKEILEDLKNCLNKIGSIPPDVKMPPIKKPNVKIK